MRADRQSRFTVLVAALCLAPLSAAAQTHAHIAPASGIPQGIPRFCVDATVRSVGSGAWSNPATWSSGRVPGGGDRVLIEAGHAISYDTSSDAPLRCVDVEGTLAFRTDMNTRLTVGTMTVLEGARLEIGTIDHPVASNVTAELVIADQAIDTTLDPGQFGTGLIGLGTIRMAGTEKSPTFVRLAAEPLAGHATLTLERAVSGWRVGDRLVLPDTRQLKQNERGPSYAPRWEELTIAAIAGNTITLTSALQFDHRGARTPDGTLEFLPHVGNISRNVVVRSANPQGTRGHTMFVERPDVDIRYALFKDMGRTRMGVLDNTEWDASGRLVRVGTNQIGRYSIHFHHAFGPSTTPASGYQFTLIGNAVDGASKWGITVHNSHYGLIRDNVVYNAHGAAIVAEDGTESFNEFVHNFAMRSPGSGDFAPRSGYGGATNDPGGEGAGFWMRGPNNIVRDNVAANVDVFGFGLAAGSLGTVPIPKFKGADPSQPRSFIELDTTDAPVREFTGNEAYGAIQTGVAIGWNGTLKDVRVWHTSRHAVSAFPTDRLVVEDLVVRGDPDLLKTATEAPTGLWFANYVAKSVTVRRANIQGMRVGIASPFLVRVEPELGRGDGVALIENSYLRNYVGVAVATAYTPESLTAPIKKAIVRASEFAALPNPTPTLYPPAAVSMNYGMQSGDPVRRDPIVVYDFNKKPGDTFRVFYSRDLPAVTGPCALVRPDVDGFVCPGDGSTQQTAR